MILFCLYPKKTLFNNQCSVSLWGCIVMLSSHITKLKISKRRKQKQENINLHFFFRSCICHSAMTAVVFNIEDYLSTMKTARPCIYLQNKGYTEYVTYVCLLCFFVLSQCRCEATRRFPVQVFASSSWSVCGLPRDTEKHSNINNITTIKIQT